MNSITKIGKLALERAFSHKPIEIQKIFKQTTNVEFSNKILDLNDFYSDNNKFSILPNEGGTQTKLTSYFIWSIRLGLISLNPVFYKDMLKAILTSLKRIKEDTDERFEIPTHIIIYDIEQTRGALETGFDRVKKCKYTIFRLSQNQESAIKDKYNEWQQKNMERRDRKK